MTTILEALKNNNLNQAKQLIGKKQELNQQDQFGLTALHIATLKHNTEIVHLLLEVGSNPNISTVVDDIDPFVHSHTTENDGYDIAQTILIQLQNLGNKTPLHIAARENLIDIAKLLIAYAANPNLVDSGLCTPLHWSAAKGNINFSKLLLENNANPNLQDLAQSTPLHEATRNQDLQTTRLLLQHNAKYNLIDITGNSPIQLASANNSLMQIYQHHLKKHADIQTLH